jgi:hypothetical protein
MASDDKIKKFIEEFIEWWLGTKLERTAAQKLATVRYFDDLALSLRSGDNRRFLRSVSFFDGLPRKSNLRKFEDLRDLFIDSLHSLENADASRRLRAADEFENLARELKGH